MNHTVIPAGYEPTLSLYETQAAISLIKRTFQDHLAQTLNLKRVSAPLFVDPSSGLNDDLNGVERPVSFDIPVSYTHLRPSARRQCSGSHDPEPVFPPWRCSGTSRCQRRRSRPPPW